MKIVADIFGADRAPVETVKGAVEALKNDGLSLVLTGDKAVIEAELAKYACDRTRIEIVDAPEVIGCDESPTAAIRVKKNSSLVVACDLLKNRADIDGMVSAGSTGAVLSGAIFKIGRMKGVLRPALAPMLPTLKGSDVCLLDCGANVDCKPEYLVQFALMGISYMRAMYGIVNPRVGLVSVGTEDEKGNELTKEVFARLKTADINLVGNMEARDALSGDFDVLVTDGFVGNVLLKTAEGTAKMVMKSLKNGIMGSTSAKIGSLFMKKTFNKLKDTMDYNKRGGAPLLGVEKVVVKAHGSCDAGSFSAAILQAAKMAKGGLAASISAEIGRNAPLASVKKE